MSAPFFNNNWRVFVNSSGALSLPQHFPANCRMCWNSGENFLHCGQRKNVCIFLPLFFFFFFFFYDFSPKHGFQLSDWSGKHRPKAQHIFECEWTSGQSVISFRQCVCVCVCVFKSCWKIIGHWSLGVFGKSEHHFHREVEALLSQGCIWCLNDKTWCWPASWLCYSKTFEEPVM